MKNNSFKVIGLVVSLALGFSVSLKADERLFGYLYEADVLPKGALEFEQWATQANGQAAGVFSRWKIREELEAGLTDDLAASLYLNFVSSYRSVIDPASQATVNTSESAFDGLSTEWKWRVLNPNQGPMGLLLYFEPRYSGQELELETKVVLQSNLGEEWVACANVTAEQEYGFAADGQTNVGKLEGGAGIAYKCTPKFTVGLEGQNRRVWPGAWKLEQSSAWSAGPTLHYAAEKWWATLTILPQIQGWPETIPGDGRFLGDDDASRVESRLIAGIGF